MRDLHQRETLWLLSLVLLAWTCGCSSDDDGPGWKRTLGPGGGSVSLPKGTTLEVPAGALDAPVTIELTEVDVPAGLPFTVVSAMFQILPSGTTFDPPATLTIPYDPAKLPEGASAVDVQVISAPGENGPWSGEVSSGTSTAVSASIDHLSLFTAGVFPLVKQDSGLPPVDGGTDDGAASGSDGTVTDGVVPDSNSSS